MRGWERPEIERCDILVVDDRAANREAIEAALDGVDCRLVMADSGTDALRQLLSRDFAVILLDVHMPGLNGLQTARLIRSRERSRHVPIIFVTAYAQDAEEVLEGYRLKAVDFLFKPVQPEILRAKVSVLVALEQRRLEMQRQARALRAHELQERETWAAEQRNRLESEALKQRLIEQRAYAEELEALNRRLAEQDLRKNEFIAALGHELRNPLAPLVSGLELMGGSTEPAVVQTRAVMQRQVEHLIRHVDDLLDTSQISRGKLELRKTYLRAGDLVKHAITVATSALEQRQHRLMTELTAPDAGIFGDEVRLTQVLVNLLNNAARYTDPGGSISLSCSAAAGGVIFSVKDSGRGMPPELLPRVFDLFVQERTGGGGLGIGLTLVKQLVELHGGNVEARSDGPGEGSEFSVWLPACQELELAAPLSLPAVSQVRHAESVVLVDDNDDARLLLGDLFVSWGCSVEHAATGEAGVGLILSSKPAVAFIDIGLPDIDGCELARRLSRAEGAERPLLVALSGFGAAKDRERALSAGFDRYLSKPAASADLQALLAEAGERRTSLAPKQGATSAS